jgi:hypothetical protein
LIPKRYLEARPNAQSASTVRAGACPEDQATPPQAIVVDLLLELVEQVKGLRADLAQHRPPSSLSREDRVLLARLLPAIGGALGSELFTSADVCEHASAALRLVRAGMNAKQLGRLLRRAADTPVAGYLVKRQGSEAGAALWQISQVPEFPGNEKVSVPHAPSNGRA